MPSQECLDWLYAFQAGTDWFLANGGGLQQATTHLCNPKAQFPSTILLVGTKEKEAALESLFPGRRHSNSRGLAQLHADHSTLNDKHPLLIASLSIHNTCGGQKPRQKQAGHLRHKVMWPSQKPAMIRTQSLVETVIGRLLLPFADVICLFLDDFSTPDEGVEFLQRCADYSRRSQGWKPQLILVTKSRYNRKGSADLPTFGSVRRVKLPANGRKTLRSNRYLTLKKNIISSLEIVRNSRSAAKRLYSAYHLNVFFELALQHVATFAPPEFDFIHATRLCNQIEGRLWLFLQDFLELCAANDVTEEATLEYIASALMLDSYPPGMHHFPPSEVFEALYEVHCHKALSSRRPEQEISPAASCSHLKARFCSFYSKLEKGTLTAVQLHKRNLENSPIDWKTMYSSRLCFYCLCRKPEHSLRCGHSSCDSCACRFGLKHQQMEHSYQISWCILCQRQGELTVRLKPPTAGSRLLVLDGGGIRGIFTLHILQALDKYRKLPYPIYDEFDLTLGTSTGGLIVLMFLLRRTLEECIVVFRELAERVFLPRQSFGNAPFAKIYGFLSSLLTDSFYGAVEMETCVKEAFGSEAALFGCVPSDEGISGLKVAVTTMAVSTSGLCILSNYNGAGVRQGYKHYRASHVQDEVLVCDAARATSAAPSYFPAKFIPGLGFLQDGGAGKHNNPIDPAEWESKAIWDAVPDVAVSVGTGFAQDPDSPQTVSGRLRFRDRFFPRLFRLFNAMLNAQSGWNDHLNRVHKDERHKYFRINIALEKEPALDDVSKIPELESLAATFLRGYNFSGITQALFAASFFFELHGKPVAKGASFLCSGSILCRSPDTRALIERILQEYPEASFTMKDGTGLGYMRGRSLCATCGHYHKAVNFKVYHTDQSVCIQVQFNRLGQHRISGFPQSMTQFVKLQLLDAEFGRPDHQIASDLGTSGCKCQITRKRKKATPLKTRAFKRRYVELTTKN